MERKIKTLYMLSIAAIIAFLGMQVYWLYSRYDYSLYEYERRAQDIIEKTLAEYNRLRLQSTPKEKKMMTIHTINNLNTDIDSAGMQKRTATITTKEFDGRELLGIADDRNLTREEMDQLATLVSDSLAAVDERRASFDVTNAPSDGASWNAMKNFELEVHAPFSAEGIDSLLRKENIYAAITLAETDSMMWENAVTPHGSVINPHFKIISPYSELEKKAVVIDCGIPASEVMREMWWTLVIAIVLSLFLIGCLVRQIKTIARLTRLDSMRNMFVTTMIHELKRPISTLKMCVSGIESDKLMEDASLRKEMAGETRMALDNLSAYFSRLRDITFNKVDQIPLNITSFDLAELVDDVVRQVAGGGRKRMIFDNGVDRGMMISADRSHLWSILTNLVENAVKYSGEEVTVMISAEISDNEVKITISDNGDGIAASDRPRIFNRFYRGKASATDIPGMGLGLAYVKLLIEAHNGDVTVESEEGAGSTFTIKLPQ